MQETASKRRRRKREETTMLLRNAKIEIHQEVHIHFNFSMFSARVADA